MLTRFHAIARPCVVACFIGAALTTSVFAQPQARRLRLGVAFGGGSARGFAHIGVIRWFEEHRIPIDLVAGTSMGGLVGGAFASGMSSAELQDLLARTDWNAMFSGSSFRYRNIRRKLDARAYPSRLEFGLTGGMTLPVSLNDGQEVDLMLSNIGAAYGELDSFDQLPTPFRCIAVDLRTAAPIVLDRGWLPVALRATMSLPGIFPPVESEGRVLVDGGAMNNVPADVVRAMGADVVVAINVGSMAEKQDITYSLFGLVGGTIDAMMLASTRRGMAAADIVINPMLEDFNSLDWRRADALAERGYQAAERLQAELLRYAVDAESWQLYLAERQKRRHSSLPVFTSVTVTGAARQDEDTIRRMVAPRVGHPVTAAELAADMETLGGLDRYQSIGWDVLEQNGAYSLLVRARPKPHGPPFLMLSTNLQNTTAEDFSFQMAGRYLAFDVLGFGSEVRVDASVGSSSSIGAEIYRPIRRSSVFVAASAGVGGRRLSFVRDDAIVAQYSESRSFAGGDIGLNLGRDSEVRLGVREARLEASPKVGNPLLPSLDGAETTGRLRWLYDSQDSPIVPTRGLRLGAIVRHVFEAPEPSGAFDTTASNEDLTQAEIEGSLFEPLRSQLDRFFLRAGAGTSFDKHPLPTDQFELGYPLRLGAFNIGERRGDHYVAVTAGYLRGIGRLPDFIGGPVFAGGWLENGSAFDDADSFEWSTQMGFGVIVDTLIGPALVGATFGFDGQRRYYISIGRLF